ncbi:hypothetical protein OMW55_04725 [Sphingomonas sp. BN140010]|uniref:Circumsporozoite protein n=1 Tax=Sphingomonas arvum TaxID=2992113 RepID=A0ABT3JEC0_9SPHN|nr:hypothetical protein [Sphingomonas sp. BN140010]MCW3797110.1 hypothetical protein [Sphingomonas sp. BN140010]
MNRFALLAAAALLLSACGKEQAASGNGTAAEEDFTRDAIVANDITAIDAATADSANMAADVAPDIELTNEGDAAEGNVPAVDNAANNAA